MKILGQHFLKSNSDSRRIIQKMIKAGEVSKKDTILEVGPGKGILTKALLEKAGKVIAVEKDKKLAEFLKEKFKDKKNLEIITGDILKANSYKLKAKSYKVVSNIPYYITSRFLKVFLEDIKKPPEKMVLMVQKEVGERIVASPRPKGRGKSPRPASCRRGKMNLLAVSVQTFGEPKIIANVSKKFFSPQPKVDSVVLFINNISKKNLNPSYFRIIKAGFSHKRKLLTNNLKSLEAELPDFWGECGIDEKARAENLSLENWRCLAFKTKSE